MTPIFSPISYGSVVKNPLAVQKTLGTQVQSVSQKDALEWEMATHSSILTWEISWTEEPGKLQSITEPSGLSSYRLTSKTQPQMVSQAPPTQPRKPMRFPRKLINVPSEMLSPFPVSWSQSKVPLLTQVSEVPSAFPLFVSALDQVWHIGGAQKTLAKWGLWPHGPA